MPSRIRLGVIGAGAVAQRGILPHLAQGDVHDRVEVVALCDPVSTRVESVADRFGVRRRYTSTEALLADDDVDAVTVASPIGLHYQHCRSALLAGKHVHVNKTMTTTREEADEVIAIARDRGLKLVASPGEVLRPQLSRTRELIESGAIGRVAWAISGASFSTYHAEGEPERSAPGSEPINPTWYFRKPGGGPLYDVTVYALHQLTSVLGPARQVTAMSGVRVAERTFMGAPIQTDADDNSLLLLDFGHNLFAVAYGTAAGSLSNQFGAGTYFGTSGKIEGVLLNGRRFDFPGSELTTGAPVSDWAAQMRVLPHVGEAHWAIPEAHVFEDIMQLVDWAREGIPSPVTAEHARHVVEIIEAALRAAGTGQAQPLMTTFAF